MDVQGAGPTAPPCRVRRPDPGTPTVSPVLETSGVRPSTEVSETWGDWRPRPSPPDPEDPVWEGNRDINSG